MIEWKRPRLNEIVQEVKGSAEIRNGETFQLWSVPSFSEGDPEVVDGSEIKSAKRPVAPGDVLLCKINPRINRVWIVGDYLGMPQVASTEWITLRPKDLSSLCPRYLREYLSSPSFREWIQTETKGATGSHTRAKPKEVLKQRVPIPPLAEQKRIVAILDEAFAAIDRAKEIAEQNAANARELFDSYLNRVFSEKGEGWDEKKLADVAMTFGRGKSRHRPRNDKSLYGGKYPFVQTGEVRNADHYITEYSQTYNEKGLAQSKLWPSGTICITIAANIAETAILTFEACIPDSVIGLVCDPAKANSEFVEYLLQYFKSVLQAEGKGSAQDNINMGTFERMLFPFPSVDEQARIVAELDAIASACRTLVPMYESKLDALDELRQSILAKAFTGQLTAKSPELEAIP